MKVQSSLSTSSSHPRVRAFIERETPKRKGFIEPEKIYERPQKYSEVRKKEVKTRKVENENLEQKPNRNKNRGKTHQS